MPAADHMTARAGAGIITMPAEGGLNVSNAQAYTPSLRMPAPCVCLLHCCACHTCAGCMKSLPMCQGERTSSTQDPPAACCTLAGAGCCCCHQLSVGGGGRRHTGGGRATQPLPQDKHQMRLHVCCARVLSTGSTLQGPLLACWGATWPDQPSQHWDPSPAPPPSQSATWQPPSQERFADVAGSTTSTTTTRGGQE